MQLSCPSCHTAYRVEPAELGTEGRTVRCTRCHTKWFARPADMVPLPAMADGDGGHAGGAKPPALLPKIVPWDDTVMVEVNPGPPLAPSAPPEIVAASGRMIPADKLTPSRLRASVRRDSGKTPPAQRRLVTVAALLAAVILIGISARASLVRAVPDLAGLYAAVGFPVNLRGLEFVGVKTAHEMQDGVPVLVIEGEVVNVARQAVEVPRLRFSVLAADERELYSWTSLLPRSVLPEGERLPFRSRLASPPADGKEIMVRFLNRMDLTSSAR